MVTNSMNVIMLVIILVLIALVYNNNIANEVNPIIIDNYSQNEDIIIDNLNVLKPVIVDNFSQSEDLSIDDLIKMNDGNLRINYHPDTNIPRHIWGQFSTRIINTPEDAVKSLSSVRTILGIDQLLFACTEEEKRDNIQVFYLQQLYEGIMVTGGYFRVYAKNTGVPDSISGVYISGIELDTTPILSYKEAMKIISLEDCREVSETLLVVYTNPEEDCRLCWRFTVAANDVSRKKHIFIDANTGEIIISAPLIRF